jgi:HK97 family phage major capsid protein
MTIEELRAKKAQKVKDMRAIVTGAKVAGSAELTAEDDKLYELYKAEVSSIEAQITRLEELEGLEAESKEIQPAASRPTHHIGEPAKKEFSCLGEFLSAVRFNPDDQRLNFNPKAAVDQTMGTPSTGGFMVPKQFSSEILSVKPSEAIVRPRARVIPAGSPPDAEFTIPALVQNSTQNMYGGVEVTWIGEGQTKPQTDAEFREIKLIPREVAAHIVVTDKLLRNWTAASPYLEGLMRGAVVAAEDQAFITGNGSNKPLGFMNANNGSRVLFNRTTDNLIKYADVLGMFAKLMGDNPVWIASKTAIPQLATLEDGNGNAMWLPSVREGVPPLLMGYPVLFSPRVPALGSLGDLSLVDLSHYLIKDGSGLFVEASNAPYFIQNKTVIKVHYNVDGKPWLDLPVVEEDAQTYSPFIILDA